MNPDLELFCLRCDRPFRTSSLTDLCDGCAYALRQHPLAMRRTPLVKKVKSTVSRTVTATGYRFVSLDETRKFRRARVDTHPPFTHGTEVAMKIVVSLPISVVNAAVSNAAVNASESAVVQAEVVGQVVS
jgi:hypothetical protein